MEILLLIPFVVLVICLVINTFFMNHARKEYEVEKECDLQNREREKVDHLRKVEKVSVPVVSRGERLPVRNASSSSSSLLNPLNIAAYEELLDKKGSSKEGTYDDSESLGHYSSGSGGGSSYDSGSSDSGSSSGGGD